jgi:hypothetical protein
MLFFAQAISNARIAAGSGTLGHELLRAASVRRQTPSTRRSTAVT